MHSQRIKGGKKTKMANNNSNYPPAQLDSLDSGFVGETVTSLRELASRGTPQTDGELAQRIDSYFDFCRDRKMRPGIESLSLALGCDRTTFWRWCGNDAKTKSDEWIRLCKQARQMIVAFTEAATQGGKLSPPVGIFLLKNLGGYKDTISFEENAPAAEEVKLVRTTDLPHFDNAPDRIEQIEKAAVALKKIPRFEGSKKDEI